MAARILWKLVKMKDDTQEIILDTISWIWNDHPVLLFTAISICVAYYIHNKNKKKALRIKWNNAGTDVVVLHGMQRGISVPNLSPFVNKLETYLRMTKIKYVYDDTGTMGPKSKIPWITLNGEDYTDSQLIMERLALRFNKDLSSKLTPEQKGAGKALTVMLDEQLFWGLEWWYFVKDTNLGVFQTINIPSYLRFFAPIMRRRMKKSLHAQGLGRHSDPEIVGIIRKNLKAVSQYLGDKKFLMGDEACEYDCTVFGQLTQFVWAMPGSPFSPIIEAEFQNLISYCERMKKTFWSDWNDCLDAK